MSHSQIDLIDAIKLSYGTQFRRPVELIFFKQQCGIVLNKEIVLFISKAFMCQNYGWDPSIKISNYSDSNLSVSDIRSMVKEEKKSREKINREYKFY